MSGIGEGYETPSAEDEAQGGGSIPAEDPGPEAFDLPLTGDGASDESGTNPNEEMVARGRELHGDEQESAATSSSLESTDGADDDLEPRGEQGGPNDAA